MYKCMYTWGEIAVLLYCCIAVNTANLAATKLVYTLYIQSACREVELALTILYVIVRQAACIAVFLYCCIPVLLYCCIAVRRRLELSRGPPHPLVTSALPSPTPPKNALPLVTIQPCPCYDSTASCRGPIRPARDRGLAAVDGRGWGWALLQFNRRATIAGMERENVNDLYDFMGWPLGGEFGRAVTKAVDNPGVLTMAGLEAAVRKIDPDGKRMATAKLMVEVEELSKQQIDNLTKLLGNGFFRTCLDEMYRGPTIEEGRA